MHVHLRFLRTTLLCFCLAVLALLPTSAAAQDGDSDGLPDSLELSLAQYYFPILNLHCGSFDGLNKADPRQLYGLTVPGYTNSSNGRIPFIAHPYSPGDGWNCTETMQCIEIRYGIAFNWDLGDDIFGQGHRGDSEMYAILVARGDNRCDIVTEVFQKVQNIGESYAPLNRYIVAPASSKNLSPSGSYDMWSYQQFGSTTPYRTHMERSIDWCPDTWCF